MFDKDKMYDRIIVKDYNQVLWGYRCSGQQILLFRIKCHILMILILLLLKLKQ